MLVDRCARHNPGAMTVFLCRTGIQGGQAIGTTDDANLKSRHPCQNLAPDGNDHKKLTNYFNGCNMRLTDVA